MAAFSSIVLWWAIPLGATLLTMLWVWWVGRSRNPDDVLGSTQRFDQFRAAMNRPHKTRRRWLRRRQRGLAPGCGTGQAHLDPSTPAIDLRDHHARH